MQGFGEDGGADEGLALVHGPLVGVFWMRESYISSRGRRGEE